MIADKVKQLKKRIDMVMPYHELNVNILIKELEGMVVVDDVVGKVEAWAIERDLHTADPTKQLLKLVEEVGEVSQAYTRKAYNELELEIGDVLVVLTIFAMQNHMTLEGCLTAAYNKIANRKGKMIDGIFVKESDL